VGVWYIRAHKWRMLTLDAQGSRLIRRLVQAGHHIRVHLKQGIGWTCVTEHYRDPYLGTGDLSYTSEWPNCKDIASDCMEDGQCTYGR
jgi:hypothetical protein